MFLTFLLKVGRRIFTVQAPSGMFRSLALESISPLLLRICEHESKLSFNWCEVAGLCKCLLPSWMIHASVWSVSSQPWAQGSSLLQIVKNFKVCFFFFVWLDFLLVFEIESLHLLTSVCLSLDWNSVCRPEISLSLPASGGLKLQAPATRGLVSSSMKMLGKMFSLCLPGNWM